MNTKLLMQKILDLAIRGKLTQQLKSDGTAADLLNEIADAKSALSQPKGKKSKDSVQITPLDKNEAPFEIPANWEWVRLGDIGKWQSGTTPSKSNSSYYKDGTIPWLNTGDLNDGIINDIPKRVTEKALAETSLRLNEAGSVCIAMYGATIGKLGILSMPATTNQACCVCNNLKSFVNRMWLFYFLMNHKQEFIEAGFGGAQPNISKEKIVSTIFPLPPLAEQQRIVEKIQEAFAEIDSIEKNKELLKTHIKQARQKILDLAIHGKLVPQNKTDGTARELLSVILSEAQSAKSKDLKKVDAKATRDNPHYEKLTDVPFEIPDSWEWVKLGDVAYIASGSTPSKEAFVDNGIPYLKMYNLRNQQIDFEYKPQYVKREIHEGKLARSKAKPGDVIMNIVGPPLGKVALVPDSLPECNFNQAAVLIRALYSSNLMNQYIRYFLLQMDEINAVNTKGTAGQENISLTQTQKMRFPLPPLAEQKRIVDRIEEIFASLDEISLHLV